MSEIIKPNSLSLAKASQIALKTISPESAVIAKLALAPKIGNITPVMAITGLLNAIRDATTFAGQEIDSGTQALFATEVYEWTVAKHPEITVDEMREAMRAGTYGEYGEYYGLNPKSFIQFIEGFITSEKRRLALLEFEKARELPPPEPPKMTVSMWKQAILTDYRLFREGNVTLIVFMPKKYILLRRLGLISLKSSESWYRWLTVAQHDLGGRDVWKARKEKDNKALNAISEILTEFQTSGALPASEYKRVVEHARKLRYLKFFDAMSTQNIDNFFE